MLSQYLIFFFKTKKQIKDEDRYRRVAAVFSKSDRVEPLWTAPESLIVFMVAHNNSTQQSTEKTVLVLVLVLVFQVFKFFIV